MGEGSRERGFEAEFKAWRILRSLNYEFDNQPDERYDIDGIGRFTFRQDRRIQRPLYSPEELTAFEISSKRIIFNKAVKFREKIDAYNEDNPDNLIVGGILMTDKHVGNSMVDRTKEIDIYTWGGNRIAFYLNKIRLFNSWNSTGSTKEICIDNDTSYLRCFCPSEAPLVRIAIFYDYHKYPLSPRKFREIMELIKIQSLLMFIEEDYKPLPIYFECHALGGVKDLSQDLLSYFQRWREEGIVPTYSQTSFQSYRVFPMLRLLGEGIVE